MTEPDAAAIAVREFRRLVPSLTAFARALTGSAQVRVEMGTTASTDGTRIWLRPPLALADRREHDRAACDDRDERGALACAACARTEAVYVSLFHELAHITGRSTEEFPAPVLREAALRGAEHGTGNYRQWVRATAPAHPLANMHGYDFATRMSPYLLAFLRAADDVRIDRASFVARPGVATMRWAATNRILERGVELPTGERLRWSERPVEAQFPVAVLVHMHGHDTAGYFDPRITEALEHPSLAGVLGMEPETMPESVELAFALLGALNKMGLYDLPLPEPPAADDEKGNDDDETAEPDAGAADPDQAPEPEPGGADADDDGPVDDGDTARGPDGTGDAGADAPEAAAGEGAVDSAPGAGDGAEPAPGPGDPAPGVPDGALGGEVGGDQDGAPDFDNGEREAAAPDPGGDGMGDAGVGPAGEPGTADGVPGAGDPVDGDRPRAGDPADPGGPDGDPADPELIYREMPDFSDVEHVDAGDVRADMHTASGHEEAEELTGWADPVADAKMERAIGQAESFDSPSAAVHGLTVTRPGEGVGYADRGWPRSATARHRPIDERLLAPSVMHARRVFSDSKLDRNVRNLRRGKLNAGALGKRAWNDDDRLFKRKLRAEGIDFEVVIGMDVSGSTDDGCIYLLKQSSEALANVLARVGVEFSLYAHTTRNLGEGQIEQVIHPIKATRDRWGTAEKALLATVYAGEGSLDGHNLEFYRKVLDRSRSRKRLMVYFTDGEIPETNRSEEHEILVREIALCKRRGYSVMAVGIGNDSPKKFGLDTIRIDDAGDIVTVVKELEKRITS